MSQIKPFQAVHFNPEKAGDISRLVCPPYDVISARQLDAFHRSNKHNFTHIMLPKDGQHENKYTRAKKTFEQWLKEEVIVQDETPSIYFYKQEYKVLGEKHSRLGIISLMKIFDEKESKVFPHEKTHAAAKEDRLKLWKSLSANLSCIFVCFSDKDRKVEQVFLGNVSQGQPFIDLKDDDGVRHIVWKLSDQKLIKQIVDSLSHQQVFIADGHHRYEVAKSYRDLKRAKAERSSGTEPYDYVMTYLTNMDSRDLKIFPMHRIIRKFPLDIEALEEYFRIDKIKNKDDLVILLAKAGKNEHAFGLYTRDGVRLLRLKSRLLIDKFIKEGSGEYKRLDATILKRFVLDKAGVPSEEIIYTKDVDEVTGMVDDGSADAGFIMNPVKIHQLKAIALNGEKMPPKTTYFYPKVLSGLTVYKMF